MLIIKDTLWNNNLNSAEDVPMIYVNFISTVITVTEQKNRRHYFHTTPHTSELKESTPATRYLGILGVCIDFS
jgi:hypothetical protein